MKDHTISGPPPHISTRLPYIKEFQRHGHKVDKKLLYECAYYPRQGCEYCRWDWPYPKCSFAHILVDTRGAGVRGWKADPSTRRQSKGKGKKQTKKEKFWESLPIELQEELKQMMEGG